MENKLNSHRAGADQWAMIEKWAKDCTYESCLIDLRDRLEALERKAAMDELRPASAEARPAIGEPTDRELRELFWYRPKGLETEAAALRRVYRAGMAAAVQSSVQREIADAEAFGLTSTSGSLVDRSAPAPAGSLVERVMIAGGMGLPESARAAIRAVAAVLDALPGAPHLQMVNRAYAAAVLRAAADQVAPSDAAEPRNNLPMALECQRIRRDILAIAAELETDR